MSADRNLTQEVWNHITNIWLPAGDHLAERIYTYVNRIQNKNLQNLYVFHTDLCSWDLSQDFQDETTVKVRRNESFKKYKRSHFKRPNKERCNVIDVARWVSTRRRNWRDHVDRMWQDRWASWAPTDPQEVARWVRTWRRTGETM
jgi:hypothetical protein